jgi:hypothetical protein
MSVDHARQTIRTGAEARFTVTFTSVGGFGGAVVPRLRILSEVPGAGVSWSASRVIVPPNGAASAILTILTLIGTPARTYEIAVQGSNGSVTHVVEPEVRLTVAAPEPGTITAVFSPPRPTVGVTKVLIRGKATAGQLVVNTSTFPDGVGHEFVVPVTRAGTYTDGPFRLRELGTYHDLLLDGATGAKTEISYQRGGTSVRRLTMSARPWLAARRRNSW